MKRDPRLQSLSSEHHRALVLARRLAALAQVAAADGARELQAAFAQQLEPHFHVEEELLVPALLAAGQSALARRLADEHASLRASATAIAAGEYPRLVDFANGLTEHVRFEERELFPCCEQCLPDSVLDAVERRGRRLG